MEIMEKLLGEKILLENLIKFYNQEYEKDFIPKNLLNKLEERKNEINSLFFEYFYEKDFYEKIQGE